MIFQNQYPNLIVIRDLQVLHVITSSLVQKKQQKKATKKKKILRAYIPIKFLVQWTQLTLSLTLLMPKK